MADDLKLVVMGVTSTGKTEVGQRLAARLDGRFIDGDDLHPPANVAKMAKGIPLEDADRWPWLDSVGEALAATEGTVVIACSALKRAYRDRIRDAAGAVRFVHLTGPKSVIAERMKRRTGHFMPLSLLDSQLATLEPPRPDEDAVEADLRKAPAELAAAIVKKLGAD
ncbi:gluconokinase [Jannaschia ovalis]|uniref:Gluconokinase n=1 Tax=Jannaschia ovalis TaxID=3038773 RepID=A0ABY8LDP1_9RHOB|nr:gluconokinase [Jannaschia sp. GRR-S6-38]WGH78185.1 gluconokinase [Jannaschia sp. GRR-S6-38]